ncbi:MAG TPA: Xaa-Pro peptidase family protein [Candidatus Acidoferrales bacterium]|nr:Xaa-Pro peptidase family protein [Candidatus Acidoferrales bacterium]
MDFAIIDKQRAAMRSTGLDALVSLSPENVTYTTGCVIPSQSLMRWRHAAAVVTVDGQVSMVVIDMEETTAKKFSAIENIRVYREFVDDPMDKLAELLRDLKLERSRIGIETDFIPVRDFQTLARWLPQASFVPAEHLLNRLREVKTATEIERMRRLSKLTDGAIGAALQRARAGMSEMDLAGFLTSGIFARGAENFKLMIVASGERSQYPNVGPTQRVLGAGDLVRMEIFGVVNGYHAGVCRTAVVGTPTPEQKKIWKNLIECKYLVMDQVGPGASCKEIYLKFLRKFSELGFEPISFVGHGIGLFLHEEPYLSRYSDRVLEEGMVLAIEPLVYIPGRMGLQNKDMLVVTKTGSELLSDVTPADELIEI